MQYLKHTPMRSFVKIDYHLINHPDLSDAAQLFYIKLSKIPQGKILTNDELCQQLGMSSGTLKKVKRELTELGYLCTKQLTKTFYMCFLGTTGVKAEEVANRYFTNKKKHEEEIIFEEPNRYKP